MNSNTLRIRGGDNKAIKGSIAFEEVVLPDSYKSDNELCKKFITSDAEGQLSILKQILCTVKENCTHNVVLFLVVAYLNADVKHPIKCMISRYVTRNSFVQDQFSDILTKELEFLLAKQPSGHKQYSDIVCKVSSCTENFPVGADAVKKIEIPLAEYLVDCLSFCITKSDSQPVSPTEKNEIFNLAHSTLRLLLYLMQKIKDENTAILISMFQKIRAILKHLVLDADAPMDTKSVCGILYVNMHEMEDGPDSWVDILDINKTSCLQDILQNESAKLSLYSAIATVISPAKLHSRTVNDTPAAVLLTESIVDIGERNSTESTIILSVARTVVQICKNLEQTLCTRQLLDALQAFVWPHLDHHTDSVRHLSAQALAHIATYYAKQETESGDEDPLDGMLCQLSALDRGKGFFVGVTCALQAVGAQRVLLVWPRIVLDLLEALDEQAVRASATTALETLLRCYARGSSSAVLHEEWVKPIMAHVAQNERCSGQIGIFEHLLYLAAKLDPGIMDYILPYIKEVCSADTMRLYRDVKCLLMLLGVVRAAGALRRLADVQPAAGARRWKDVLSYEVLKMAAVDVSQEVRLLSIYVVVESPKSTEPFAAEELDFVLWFMEYNINARAPNFRQHVLSYVKKFIKRLENSYRVLLRENSTNGGDNKCHVDYLKFVKDFRTFCFGNLLKGANYSRRQVALQVLVWLEDIRLDGNSNSVWTESDVETLLYHLADSYDTNKAKALQLLTRCPQHLLKQKYCVSLELQDILAEASSVKPTDCMTAVHKLKLLRAKLPERIVQGDDSSEPNKVKLALLRILLAEVQKQLTVCQQSLVVGARSAPMYGVLHCVAAALEPVAPFGINSADFIDVVQRAVTTCVQVCECAGAVLSSAAPEGLLPDVTPDTATCDTAGGHIRLEDGREVTAQMVLLCAWRSVKEVSLILATIVNQILVHDEIEPATRDALVERIGDLFTMLLTETKHRGAFEQVYVGFTKLLTSLWRSPLPQFNALPVRWLRELMAAIEIGEGHERLCATRRSAGLPFMIQALVITELQVKVNTKSFDGCMRNLLRLARVAPSRETRCHCLNILRALYRCAQLDEAVGAHVGAGLMVALLGFDSGSWIERNSATLLFSALMVRVFGVQRSRDSERLCARNRMTGRIFFLRYPELYDFMLNKLKEVSEQGKEELHPSLYPILLLLARLYPSSLEGTVSNLKLSTFVPLVVRCAGSSVLHARRLAASAIVPLVPPAAYISHVESMLQLLCDEDIKRNYCHGILLQILKLLENWPVKLVIDSTTQIRIAELFGRTVWILRQCGGERPCYVIADEYIKIVNVLLWRFPMLLGTNMEEIEPHLRDLLLNGNECKVNPGREMFMSNATYLHVIILCLYATNEHMCRFVNAFLAHNVYEVVLACFNCLLIMYDELPVENALQQHLAELWRLDSKLPYQLQAHAALDMLRREAKHIDVLRDVYFAVHAFMQNGSRYVEWSQKCLKLIALEPDTQMSLIKARESWNKDFMNPANECLSASELVIDTLTRYVKEERESLTHIYLMSLCQYVAKGASENTLEGDRLLAALRVIFACSLPDNSCETRNVVVNFLKENLKVLWTRNLDSLNKEDQFEFKALLCASTVAALEDDDDSISSRASHAVTLLGDAVSQSVTRPFTVRTRETLTSAPTRCYTLLPPAPRPRVTASRARELLLQLLRRERHAVALLTVVALLDFKAEVCLNDDVNDESRVFDQNERYNVHLEETIWTCACADAIKAVQRREAPHIHVIPPRLVINSTQCTDAPSGPERVPPIHATLVMNSQRVFLVTPTRLQSRPHTPPVPESDESVFSPWTQHTEAPSVQEGVPRLVTLAGNAHRLYTLQYPDAPPVQESVQRVVTLPMYACTLDSLCGPNVAAYRLLVAGQVSDVSEINPKVELFYYRTRRNETFN